MTQATDVHINAATFADVPLILEMIRGLAIYEKLEDQVVVTEAILRESLFGAGAGAGAGPGGGAECLIARVQGQAAGFALFFHNFSTWLGRRGLYLEDLFVQPAFRGHGVGKALLTHLAGIAVARDCGRFEWQVLDWNQSARDFYEKLGAQPNPGWINYRITGDALRRLAQSDRH
jgi:GNAT superfamily N-acetyltransferase